MLATYANATQAKCAVNLTPQDLAGIQSSFSSVQMVQKLPPVRLNIWQRTSEETKRNELPQILHEKRVKLDQKMDLRV